MVFYFSLPLIYTPVNILLTILSYFFVYTILPKWDYRMQVSTWTLLFEKCTACFFTCHTTPTKVTDLNNPVHTFQCLLPCFHSYLEFTFHTHKGCFRHFTSQEWHPSICATTSCFSHLTIHHGNHIILLSVGIRPWFGCTIQKHSFHFQCFYSCRLDPQEWHCWVEMYLYF